MKVAELMRKNLKTVSAQDTLEAAVTVLAEAHVSGLPVVDHRSRLVGVITKRLFVEQDGQLVGVLSQTDIVGALAAGKL